MHLHARRREQDVDARRVAPEDVGEVALRDAVGRQIEDRWGIGRHPQQRAHVAELEAAIDERGPRLAGLRQGDRKVEGDGRLAHAALGREDREDARSAFGLLGLRLGHDRLQEIDELEAAERHRQHGIDALVRVPGDRVLGHGHDDDGRRQSLLAQARGEVQAAHLALQQGVDHDDVGVALAHELGHLAAVADHVEELDVRLGVEQATNVLRHLRHVLDEQEADLVGRA